MHPFAEALRRRDARALQAELAPDAVYRSPVMYCELCGPAVAEMLAIVLAAVTRITHLREFGNADVRVLLGTITVRGHTGEATWVLHLDDDEQVRRIAFRVRPAHLMTGLTGACADGLLSLSRTADRNRLPGRPAWGQPAIG
jgi:hypothetical protein